MSARWIRCAPWQLGPNASRCCSTNWPAAPARIPGWTATSNGCGPDLTDLETIQYRARKVAEDICLALQGSLLVRHGHPAVAEAFLATRLGGAVGRRVRHHADRAGPGAHPRARPGEGLSDRGDPRDQAGRFRQPEDDDLRGHRPGRAHHLQPAGEGQRDRRRHSAGALGVGGARRPGSRRTRHPGVRSRRGFLRGLRPVRLRRWLRLGRRHRSICGHGAGRQDPGRSTTCRTSRGTR